MDDLIAALLIFSKYTNNKYPTNCSHDELRVCHVPVSSVTLEDTARLAVLGFSPENDATDCEDWISFRFGSC